MIDKGGMTAYEFRLDSCHFNKMTWRHKMKLKGVILKEGKVLGDDGREYFLPVPGIDSEGFVKVLMDAKYVGGDGFMHRQSIQPYIGYRVEFIVSRNGYGYNYKIISKGKEA